MLAWSSVKINGEKGGILANVKLKVSEEAYFELHIDTDDANANLIKNDQLYIIFKANTSDTFKIFLNNEEELLYLINLKRILVIDLTNLKIDEDDIIHLPFI